MTAAQSPDFSGDFAHGDFLRGPEEVLRFEQKRYFAPALVQHFRPAEAG
jgi:hypothetical protein